MTPDIASLIQQAEAARDQGALDQAVALASSAWRQVPPDDAGGRRRVGLLLIRLRQRSGDLAEVVTFSEQLLPLLRANGPSGELIDTLRLVALCAAETSQFTLGMACAQEGHRLAQGVDDRGRQSQSLNALGCLFERIGDPWQAERLMLESLALARQAGDEHALWISLNNLGAALIGRFYLLRDAMPLAEARACLVQARPYAEEFAAMAKRGSDRFYTVFSLGNLGEILVHLGEADTAEALLGEAMALATDAGYVAQRWRLGCSQAELALVRRQPEAAWQQLSALLQAAADADQTSTHLRLHHALWRAAAELGRPADALHHLQTYVTLERRRSVAQLQAQSALFVTRMEAEQLRQEASRQRSRVGVLEVDVRRDHLTGLGNRRELEARWPEVVAQAQATGLPLSVAMADLDHFKQVNDTHGHAVGDQVLVRLAELLRHATRALDMVVRLGGEEFLLVLPDTGAAPALDVCERLRQRVAEHDWSQIAPGLRVTLSIGLGSAPPLDMQSLTLNADAALYRAKQAGRNQVVVA